MEAKGSDVPDLPPMTDEERREHSELSEKLRLLFQGCSQFGANEMSVYWGIFAYRVNKEIEARVQAAAVEMRARCVKTVVESQAENCPSCNPICHACAATKIRALPIPTNAYDEAIATSRHEGQGDGLQMAVKIINGAKGIGGKYPDEVRAALDAALREKELAVARHVSKAAEDGCQCEPCLAVNTVLLRARTAGVQRAAELAVIADTLFEVKIALHRELAALTQPAPEKEKKR